MTTMDIDTAYELCGIPDFYVDTEFSGEESFAELEDRFACDAGYCNAMRSQGWEIMDAQWDKRGMTYLYRHEDGPEAGGFGPCAICYAPATHVYSLTGSRSPVGEIRCDSHNQAPAPNDQGTGWEDVTGEVRAVYEAEEKSADSAMARMNDERPKLEALVTLIGERMKAEGLEVPDRAALYKGLGYHHVLILAGLQGKG
jgi:hypothetical protein